jgi:hypothetical protein
MTQLYQMTISFANGGYVVERPVQLPNGEVERSVDIHTTTAKLMKAVRTTVDEFSLLPKKQKVDKSDDE